MRLLDRYLLRELVIPLGYCLGGFLLFWIFFDLFTELDSLQQDKLTASNGAANDSFGKSVSISADHAIVGAHFDDDSGSNSGSAYTYGKIVCPSADLNILPNSAGVLSVSTIAFSSPARGRSSQPENVVGQ